MKNISENTGPPGVLRKILTGILNEAVRTIALGEFDDKFTEISAETNRVRAVLWYFFNIAAMLPSFLVDKMYWSCTMINNYLKVALRAMLRHKGYSFINIAGLAVGVACCLLIMLWVQHELSYDRYHENLDRTYRVVQNIPFSDHSTTWAITQGPLGESLAKDNPEIESFTRHMGFLEEFTLNDQKFAEMAAFVDPGFFEIFSYKLLSGSLESGFNDPNSIVLTQSLAQKLFGDADPHGMTLLFNKQYEKTIIGVIEDVPDNSSIQYDFLAPFIFLREYGMTVDSWGNSGFTTIVMLKEGISHEEASSKIGLHLDDKPTLEKGTVLNLQPFADIHLKSNLEFDMGGRGDINYVYTFSLTALFILLIACINFMNLATARAGNRAKEIGMRKVVGAYRKNIIAQFFGESILMASIAVFLAVITASLLLSQFNLLSGKMLQFNPFTNGFLSGSILAIALLTGLVSGSYPALFLSSFNPVKTIRGALSMGARGAGFRKMLVIIQFAITIILISGTAVIYFQLDFMRNKKLGYTTENVIYAYMPGEIRKNYTALRDELLKQPEIVSVTASSNIPSYGVRFSNSKWEWEGKDPGQELLIRAMYVDFDYFETYGMEMVEGRTYSRDMATDSMSAIILNEAAVKAMGMTDPLGKWLGRDEYKPTIIGVVKDYNFRNLRHDIEPQVLLLNPQYSRFISMSVTGKNIENTISNIKAVWSRFDAENDMVLRFLDDQLNRMYRAEQRIGVIFRYFAALAIIVSCLGLFGLASFTAEQRSKEIGIRKVLGANVSGIILLLSREFTRWVLVANLIAWPAAYLLMNKWLQSYANRIDIGISIFVISGLLALLVALLTVSYQAAKAALADPVKSLKYE